MAGSKTVKGKDTKVRLMRNGAPVNMYGLKSFSAEQDADFTRDEYLGEVKSVGDTDHKGWTGSAEWEITGPEVMEAADALITNNLERVNADEIQLMRTFNFRDGTSKSFVYTGVQLKLSDDSPGMHEKSTLKMDWQADDRLAV